MNKQVLKDLYVSFVRIGGFTFGGGYSMLPMLEKEAVELRGWATREEIIDTFALAQCSPGVIAVNTATYIGCKQAGALGGIVAALGIVTPSLLIILLIASLMNNFIDLPTVQYALAGIRAGVCALVLRTVISLLKNNIKNTAGVLLFAGTFLSAVFLSISPVIPIVLSILVGVLFLKDRGEAS